MAKELIEEICERYNQLKNLSANHELLKYFVQTAEGFKLNPDTEVAVEFTERFRAGAPDLEQLIKQQKKTSFAEYKQGLVSAVFGNYLSALKQAVREIISRN